MADKYDDEAKTLLDDWDDWIDIGPAERAATAALIRRLCAEARTDEREKVLATACDAAYHALVARGAEHLADAVDDEIRGCEYDAAIRASGAVEVAESELFYIENTDHRFDFKLWWGPKSSGYTVILEDAGVYTEAEARAQQRSRSSDIARRKSVVDAAAAGRVVSRRAIIDDDPPPDGATR